VSPLSRLPLLLLLALAFGHSSLRADTIYTNFDADSSYAAAAGLIVTNDAITGASVAIAFTPSDNYNLTSLEFVASDLIPNFSDDSNHVTLGIFADNGGLPGSTPLESFNVILTGMFGDKILVTTVSSILQPLLQANTQYWVGMNAAHGDLVIWNQNVTSANGFAETDGFGNWSAADPFQPQGVLEVDGALAAIQPASGTTLPSSVPEPGVWTLMAVGLAALAFLYRRWSASEVTQGSACERPSEARRASSPNPPSGP
jgi:hypothetical protein